jgi:hypothetical protein
LDRLVSSCFSGATSDLGDLQVLGTKRFTFVDADIVNMFFRHSASDKMGGVVVAIRLERRTKLSCAKGRCRDSTAAGESGGAAIQRNVNLIVATERFVQAGKVIVPSCWKETESGV